jgi:transposase-like protein
MERRKFTRKFKLEAVRLIRDRGVSYVHASQDLNVHTSQLSAALFDKQMRPSSRKRVKADQRLSMYSMALATSLRRESLAHAAPHIGAPDRQPDPYARGDRNHRRSNTSSTRRNACRSKPLPTQIRYLPATSISIFSATVDGGAATPSCSAVITTGISREADGSDGTGGASR